MIQICRKCAECKSPEDFDPHNLICRSCRNELAKARYHRRKGPVQCRVSVIIGGKKQCVKCRQFKEMSADYFNKQAKSPESFMNTCRTCGINPPVLKVKKHRIWKGRLF